MSLCFSLLVSFSLILCLSDLFFTFLLYFLSLSVSHFVLCLFLSWNACLSFFIYLFLSPLSVNSYLSSRYLCLSVSLSLLFGCVPISVPIYLQFLLPFVCCLPSVSLSGYLTVSLSGNLTVSLSVPKGSIAIFEPSGNILQRISKTDISGGKLEIGWIYIIERNKKGES